MTQKEKDLLLKDLCARLQSGLICSIYREDDEGFGWRDAECKGYFQNNNSYEFYFEDVITIDNIERLKPYLRPMSSLSKAERAQLEFAQDLDMRDAVEISISNVLEFFLEHHLDYYGLIPMGLALPAKEGMYNI